MLAVALSVAADAPPAEKSNVRDVTEAVAPSLRPGDLVVTTWPEQVPVLAYYLPEGLRYATLTGPVPDLGVTDWRDGVERLEATSAERDLAPLMDGLRPGRRMALVQPIIYDLGPWSAPWTELVRLRSEEWAQYVSNDRRFGVDPPASRPPLFPRGPDPGPGDGLPQDARSRPRARGAPRVALRRRAARGRGGAAQRQHEAGAGDAGLGVGEAQVAAHAHGELAADREAEAEAALRARGAAAVEALEDVLALLRRDAAAAVGDRRRWPSSPTPPASTRTGSPGGP